MAVLPNISVDIDSIDLDFTTSFDQFNRRSTFFSAKVNTESELKRSEELAACFLKFKELIKIFFCKKIEFVPYFQNPPLIVSKTRISRDQKRPNRGIALYDSTKI